MYGSKVLIRLLYNIILLLLRLGSALSQVSYLFNPYE